MNTNRIFNFSAGPSMLPLPVLEKAAALQRFRYVSDGDEPSFKIF